MTESIKNDQQYDDVQSSRPMEPRSTVLATYSPCGEKNRDEWLEKIAIK